jgi:glycosyltransferase involved in cell wall biosynthesis
MVDEELPYPANSGKRIRTLNLTLRLARRHRITFLSHRNADPAEARRAAAFLQSHGIETATVERTIAPKRGPGFYARLAANLVSPLPYSVASHNSRALQRAIRTYAGAQAVDLWHCEWTPYAAALDVLGGARHVLMAHNVESLIWQRYHETTPDPLRRWYIGLQWRKFERFERRAFGRATRTVAVSDTDAALIRERFGGTRVDVVDNGVDAAYFRPTDVARDPRQVLFLGSLDWRPNLDAVGLLLEQIFPAVRAQEPAARLCLVGRHPPAVLRRRVANCAGVTLHADVDDVRPYLTGSGVLAVPLRIGGGSRLKILEALACGLPVVSTRVGAEGLDLEANKHLTVVPDIADMAAALVECLRDATHVFASACRPDHFCGRPAFLPPRRMAVWRRRDVHVRRNDLAGRGQYRRAGWSDKPSAAAHPAGPRGTPRRLLAFRPR